MMATHNSAIVASYTYHGSSTTLTWDIQNEICESIGVLTPGTSDDRYLDKHCAYSPERNFVVASYCGWAGNGNGDGQWADFVGEVPVGTTAYMCTDSSGSRLPDDVPGACTQVIEVTGTGTVYANWNAPVTINDGDSVFCQEAGHGDGDEDGDGDGAEAAAAPEPAADEPVEVPEPVCTDNAQGASGGDGILARVENENSMEKCNAACVAFDADSPFANSNAEKLGESVKCGAFDYTADQKSDSCRLYTGNDSPRTGNGGGDNRKYCTVR